MVLSKNKNLAISKSFTFLILPKTKIIVRTAAVEQYAHSTSSLKKAFTIGEAIIDEY